MTPREATSTIESTRALAVSAMHRHREQFNAIAAVVADLDAAVMQMAERTVDDRLALLVAQQRLALLLEGQQ
mgnify:FL=1